MRLSPLDIRKQDFNTSLRGYDREDVDTFLQMVSEQWEEVIEEHRRLEDEVRVLNDRMEHYQQVEEALQEALQTARENAESKIENAEREATLLIQEAEARAKKIKREAREERDQFRQEANRVSEQRDEIVARLRAFLRSEMELLARFSGDDPADMLHTLPSEERQPSQQAGPEDFGQDLDQVLNAPPLEKAAPSDDQNASTKNVSGRQEPAPQNDPMQEEDASTGGDAFEIDQLFGDATTEETTSGAGEATRGTEASEAAPADRSTTGSESAEKDVGALPSDDQGADEWNIATLLGSSEGKAPDHEDTSSKDESGGSGTVQEEDEDAASEGDELTATSEEIKKIRRILNDLE